MREELNSLDIQRQTEQQEHHHIINKLKEELAKYQEQNSYLEREFENYREIKEEEIVSLKIDKNTIQTEYEEYKHNYNFSVTDLKTTLKKLKSDYKLLNLENSTLQELLAKEKQQKDKNALWKNGISRQSHHSSRGLRRSQINWYESLPIEMCENLEDGNNQRQRYNSVRRKEFRGPYTPNRVETQSSNDDYEINERKLNSGEDINMTSQSPVLYKSIPKSENTHERTNFSGQPTSFWIQNPF